MSRNRNKKNRNKNKNISQRWYENPERLNEDEDEIEIESPKDPITTEQKLPAIVVSGRDHAELVSTIIEELDKANNPPFLFVRGGKLVRVLEDECGLSFIDEVNEKIMMNIATLHMKFLKVIQTKYGPWYSPTVPSIQVMHSILARGKWPFPKLRGITTIPPVNSSGDISLSKGYSPVHKIYYCPCEDLNIPVIPECPTEEDVLEAKRWLLEPFVDFPFEDQYSQINLLGTLITMVLRPAIDDTVPLSVISATNRGTGKTLISKILGTILLGTEPSLTTYPHKPDELKKVFTSLLVKGSQLIIFDNFSGSADSSDLAAVLTSRLWEDRLLGFSKMVRLPQEATWIINGNNINMSGDLMRRSVLIRLKSELSQPWLKKGFQHDDLITWVKDNRGKILWSVYVLFRFWQTQCNSAPSNKIIGGYSKWIGLIGGILENAGFEGFLENLDQFYEVSGEQDNQAESFLGKLSEIFGSEAFKVSDVISKLSTNADLRDCLPGSLVEKDFFNSVNQLTQKANYLVGKFFSSIHETRFGKSSIYIKKSDKDAHNKVNYWKVVCGEGG